jgi:hypothetical protein
MRVLSSSDFLDLWERGRRFHPLDQCLLAIVAAFPAIPPAKLADWPLGRRNSALAAVHRACFGASLQGWLSCPRCRQKLEFELDSQRMLDEGTIDERDAELGPVDPIVVGEHRFRLPTSRDIATAAGENDSQMAVIRLVESCWLGTGEPPRWSEEDIEEIGQRMALSDPMGETRMTLECPECGNHCDEILDLPSFLWTEIEAGARRLLTEIHILASAYGWAEREILSLSEPRRALYLEMVRG